MSILLNCSTVDRILSACTSLANNTSEVCHPPVSCSRQCCLQSAQGKILSVNKQDSIALRFALTRYTRERSKIGSKEKGKLIWFPLVWNRWKHQYEDYLPAPVVLVSLQSWLLQCLRRLLRPWRASSSGCWHPVPFLRIVVLEFKNSLAETTFPSVNRKRATNDWNDKGAPDPVPLNI